MVYFKKARKVHIMKNGKNIFAIIMAAGKGTRIGATDRPKVMFEVFGKPIIGWGIEPLDQLKKEGVIDRIITVVGFFGNQIIDYLRDRSEFVWQKEQLGTGHAVKMAEKALADEQGYTIIVNGDHALYTKKTYEKVINTATRENLTLGFATVVSDRFESYGRVVRDGNGSVAEIIEVPEATEDQKKIRERSINLYIVDNQWLFRTLPKISPSAVKKEYYIVDIVKMAIAEGKKVETVQIDNEDEALGVNTLEDKAETEEILKKREQNIDIDK
jgi:bifunctional N-acetylglucosamine-1-phosphate-uridyltransferase/glucosamine-1-phosphate-acetyltransferase GlmU-like protein